MRQALHAVVSLMHKPLFALGAYLGSLTLTAKWVEPQFLLVGGIMLLEFSGAVRDTFKSCEPSWYVLPAACTIGDPASSTRSGFCDVSAPCLLHPVVDLALSLSLVWCQGCRCFGAPYLLLGAVQVIAAGREGAIEDEQQVQCGLASGRLLCFQLLVSSASWVECSCAGSWVWQSAATFHFKNHLKVLIFKWRLAGPKGGLGNQTRER